VRVQRAGDTTTLVRQASVVVAITSTVVYESLIAGTPVVLLAYPGFRRFPDGSGAPFLVGTNEEEAAGLIRRLLADAAFAGDCRERCTAYARSEWPLCGGGAARRVADLIRSVSLPSGLTGQNAAR
jgi:glycosyltransferase involved in cell wall biosynthesis